MNMDKFSKTLTITGKEQTAVNDKIEALTVLANKLSTKELKKLALVVANDPVKTALAKKYLGV